MKGITEREAGFQQHTKTKKNVILNMSNVHTFTTYELRQALEARGYPFHKCQPNDDGSSKINHRFLLQELVKLIQKEEQERQEMYYQNNMNHVGGTKTEDATLELQKILQERKERRKAEAMERSRQRQLNQLYFLDKIKQNQDPKTTNPKNVDAVYSKEKEENNNHLSPSPNQDNEYPLERNSPEIKKNYMKKDSNPFKRLYVSKIGGKCA